MDRTLQKPILSLTTILLALSIFALAFPPPPATAQNYSVVSGILPPWTIDSETGIFPELFMEIQKRLDHPPHTVTILPWSRAQEYAKTRPNYILFPLTRVQEREHKYTWIADVWPLRLAFGSVNKPPKSLEEARKLKSVSVHQHTPTLFYLQQHGFTNIAPLTTSVDTPRMLERGRVDTWFSAIDLMEYTAQGTEAEGRMRYSPVIITERLWLAASADFPLALAKTIRETFEAIKEDGTFDAIVAKYLR